MALICLTTIIISSWYILKTSRAKGLVQLHIGKYPFWVQQVLVGRWCLYVQEQFQEEIVGVGPTGLITENIKTKRYYLGTLQDVVELTPGNFQQKIMEISNPDHDLITALHKIGFTFEKVPDLINACNAWRPENQQVNKSI